MKEALGEVPDVVVPYVGAGMCPSTSLSQIHLCTSSALRQEARVHTDRSLLVPTSCLEMARRTHSELYKRVGTSTFSATNSASPKGSTSHCSYLSQLTVPPILAPGYWF
ncbi:hypothetical protein M404DRAFT_1002968 [Pisolithus tinctorius Marx 270]|uniref:Uncharacterized protein n=1 Tax=Pisolithus tinctorius Marx 270 TaxID=870435 RepID=A0A0C3P221_PISTI|nr:hypothetical protein M404DRAFT_1002968 [Pisolithus tinctorius Marx 270]